MICALKPADENEIKVQKQEREVSAAEWLPLAEFYEKSSVFNTTFLDHYLAHRQLISPRHCHFWEDNIEMSGLFYDSNKKLN